MKEIWRSASKIVFLMIALTACIGLFLGKITSENFMILATGAFAYYFTKATPSESQIQTTLAQTDVK